MPRRHEDSKQPQRPFRTLSIAGIELRCDFRILMRLNWVLSSAGSERRPYKAEVEGSNPSAPTRSMSQPAPQFGLLPDSYPFLLRSPHRFAFSDAECCMKFGHVG